MDLIATPGLGAHIPRIVNWPSNVPCLFVPADEAGGPRIANHGTMGPPTFGVQNKKTQWTSEGWLTTNSGEGIWPTDVPEGPTLLDKLYFYRNCVPASPGIGGNILLVSFTVEAAGGQSGTPQTRVLTAGISGIDADAIAWQLIMNNSDGRLRFFWRDGSTEIGSSLLPPIGAGAKHRVVLLLDALNKDVFMWQDGIPTAISAEVKTSITDLFVQASLSTSDWDTNGITLTIGGTNWTASGPGTRVINGSNKHLFGKPFGDLLIADVTALDSVLAVRRDDIAGALYKTPRGYLSSDVSDLLS